MHYQFTYHWINITAVIRNTTKHVLSKSYNVVFHSNYILLQWSANMYGISSNKMKTSNYFCRRLLIAWNQTIWKNDHCRCITQWMRCGRQTGWLAGWCADNAWAWTFLPNDVNWNFCRALTTVASVEHSLLVSDTARHNAESLPRRTINCVSAHMQCWYKLLILSFLCNFFPYLRSLFAV